MPQYLHGSAKELADIVPKPVSYLPPLFTPQNRKNRVDEPIFLLSQRHTTPSSLFHIKEIKTGINSTM